MQLDTRLFFLGLIALVIAERLAELVIARRNTRWALARGGVEAGAGHYPWIAVTHALFLIACPLEVWLLDRPFHPWLAAGMLSLLAAAMGMRYWVIATLGRRWTTRVICLPGRPPITSGPFRFVRHPNYLAVMFEFVALPLVHTAWLSALVFAALNAVLLAHRIRVEEEALSRHCDYRRYFPALSPGPE